MTNASSAQREGETNSYRAWSTCDSYNGFFDKEALETMEYISDTIYPSGRMIIRADHWHELGGVDSISSMMGLNNDYSFQLVKTQKSRGDDGISYYRYQQYYKNILVEGGGFTIAALAGPGPGPENPCLEVKMLFPFVATEVHSIDPIPLSSISVANTLGNYYVAQPQASLSVLDTNMSIWPNLLNDCAYHLAWDVNYIIDGESKRAWVDAKSGTVLNVTDGSMNLVAPMETPGYGQLPGNTNDLNDSFDGSATRLISENLDSEVRTYDFGGNMQERPLSINLSEWPDAFIPSTNLLQWDGTIASPHVYQAHFATTECVKIFSSSLEIDFGTVRVAVDEKENAIAYSESTDFSAFIALGFLGGSTTAIFDIVAHELGHCYMFGESLEYTNAGNESLHEGIADMFGTYVESVIQGTVDWVIGDDESAVATEVNRDLANPEFNCFSDVENLLQQHTRSTPLSHWFFLVSTGDPALGINSLGMETVLGYIMDALAANSSLSDYSDLKDAVLGVVELQHSVCSEEYTSIARAWNEICVGNTPICPYTITGNTIVYEENNVLSLCINGGIPNATYRWYVPGDANWTANGQSGTNLFEGTCLYVTQFDNYPYYPQFFKIDVYSPTVGPAYNQSITVTLIDRDGDDPTCWEYYDSLQPLMHNNEGQHESAAEQRLDKAWLTIDQSVPQQSVYWIKGFDIMGRLVYDGLFKDIRDEGLPSRYGMLMLQYFDENGKWLGTQKVMPNR
ncbi:M4 family metallopeptidase [Phaeodactylibacter xiamenensis]|uniref:M4 family metallopeptidase n=1 Tax=Phaeodactylibacter xiamenensis TaxID=1524460 RepID=UPI003CCB7633